MKFSFLKIKIIRTLLWGMAFLLTVSPAYAYTQKIITTPQEIWEAVRQVMEPHGIRKENSETWEIESKWIKDYARREKKILPDPIQIKQLPTVKQTVLRRYRMQVKLKDQSDGTQIKITGEYQEKPTGTPAATVSWKRIKPSTEDYELERQFFYEVLKQMGKNRTASAEKQPSA
ncbi:MAG: hypothetical protein H6757_06030 [Candidatus Omnitrophica bacterium]|nr:hypothetical protein [Candidatus Omnitrophota bacterium]